MRHTVKKWLALQVSIYYYILLWHVQFIVLYHRVTTAGRNFLTLVRLEALYQWFMALTATATVQTRIIICKALGMSDPVIIVESLNKPNIRYIVQLNPGTLEEAFASIVKEVQCSRQHREKVIIFYQSYDSCSSVYLFLRDRLGREMTHPIGAPDIAVYRMVNMYIRVY